MVPDAEFGDGPVKASMDYMYLHERRGKYRDAAHNPPHMIMIEHARGRCWAYRVPSKGIMDEAHWLPERMVQDFEIAGMNHTKIHLKSDQEPSIVSVQKAIMEIRPNTIPTNSLVGESVCNGRIENIIRRVQEKVMVLSHQVDQGIRIAIPDNAPIMSWLVRWVAELLCMMLFWAQPFWFDLILVFQSCFHPFEILFFTHRHVVVSMYHCPAVSLGMVKHTR